MVIEVVRARPMLANRSGGLTGPAIRPIAVHSVWEVAQIVSIPLIGIGGVERGRDALEFLFAGATAIGIGTANFRDPLVHVRVVETIEAEMRRRSVTRVDQLTGLANPGFAGKRIARGAPVGTKDTQQ
jgi:dihydroorotate dehydrogenase (NAD+) catalytic subunit